MLVHSESGYCGPDIHYAMYKKQNGYMDSLESVAHIIYQSNIDVMFNQEVKVTIRV